MRKLGLVSSALVIAALVIMSCVDPAEEQDGSSDESSTAASVLGDVQPNAVNCSIVQYCNVPANLPHGTDGTRCIQQGCSLGVAENECKREAKLNSVCGGITAPFIFVDTFGDRITLNPAGTICAGNAIECGQHCCGASATFCAGTRCCDGVTCGGGCPC